MYKYGYALEKFRRAIYSLAVGEDEIKKRLLIVFQGDLLCITLEHLPEKIREDYKWILKQIEKYDEEYKGQTKIVATLHRIRRNTAAKIAERIYAIWEVVEEESTRTS